ncbi:MAG TPA: hypothetical protein VKU82_10885 [Planctomycetaceae bacterium]|nr:hypothetical protein [Planctomycetaceae bacterium]
MPRPAATATRTFHPAVRKQANGRSRMPAAPVSIPRTGDNAEINAGGRTVRLTHLGKVFWPALGITKGDLLSYYSAVAKTILPHLRDRAMVMKRYPNVGRTGSRRRPGRLSHRQHAAASRRNGRPLEAAARRATPLSPGAAR